jgi:hypothetical protein
MARDDGWLMGALAAQDAYRGGDADFPPPPVPSGAMLRTGVMPRSFEEYLAAAAAPREREPDQLLPPPADPLISGHPRVAPLARGVSDAIIETVRKPLKMANEAYYGSYDGGGYDNNEQLAGDIFENYTMNMLGAGSLAGRSMRGAVAGAGGGRLVQPTIPREAPGGAMGAVFEQQPAMREMASPATINLAAAESRKGITKDALRGLYDELGLTGREPSELVRPALAERQPEALRQQAIELKIADRAVLDTLSSAQRRIYAEKGKIPGVMLPSQEVAQPAVEAFEPIRKQVEKAEKAFDKRPSSLFDLSAERLMQTPDVPQFNLPRVAPGMTERLASVPRGGMARLERAAANAPLENWGWYNLMQTRDLFHNIHGKERGEQAFNAWLDGVAGTSMVNPIDNNIRSSTWYLQQILQGKPLPEVIHFPDPVSGKAVKTMAGGPPAGYGAKSQIQHADRVLDYLTHTYDPVGNPKPISYRMNLGGNWMPRTVDTHDIRNMVGMPQALELFGASRSGLLPKEYSYLEDVGRRAAERAGTAQAPQQAATWVGGGIPSPDFPKKGGYTGLKSFPAPLQEVINRRAHVTAMVRGISPEQALHDAFTGRAPLLGIGGAAAGATGMGALADQGRYD